MAGYVYIIGNMKRRWYKIGKSSVPIIRIQDLGILLPFHIEIFAVWKAANHHLLEQTLHERYYRSRINGEWFRFSSYKIRDIVSEKLLAPARIFPVEGQEDSVFAKFSNNVRGEKQLTAQERERRKAEGISVGKIRRSLTTLCSACGQPIKPSIQEVIKKLKSGEIATHQN